MACVIDLGTDAPCDLRVRVIDGLAWTSQPMTRSDESAWHASLRLVFEDDTTWPATLTDAGLTATIHATGVQVSAVEPRARVTLRDDTRVYGTGRVSVLRMPL